MRGMRNLCKFSSGKSKEKRSAEHIDVILLKWILKWIGFGWLRTGINDGVFEHVNETAGYTIDEKFLDCLSGCKVLKDTAP
jgi:hypothetical protein